MAGLVTLLVLELEFQICLCLKFLPVGDIAFGLLLRADVFESDGSRAGSGVSRFVVKAAARTTEAKVIQPIAVWRWREVKFSTVISLVPERVRTVGFSCWFCFYLGIVRVAKSELACHFGVKPLDASNCGIYRSCGVPCELQAVLVYSI